MVSLRNIFSYIGIIHIYMCVTVSSRQRCKTIGNLSFLAYSSVEFSVTNT